MANDQTMIVEAILAELDTISNLIQEQRYTELFKLYGTHGIDALVNRLRNEIDPERIKRLAQLECIVRQLRKEKAGE